MNKTYLAHHGIKGQRWGVRRFQNNDGSLTRAGRKKYDVNEDGTTRLKDGYRKTQNRTGLIKTAIGTGIATKGVLKVVGAKKGGMDFTSKSGKKTLNKTIFAATLGAIVISSGAKNFLNANKSKTFNTIGKGGTPEQFKGKPKTQAQVLAAQKRNKK